MDSVYMQPHSDTPPPGAVLDEQSPPEMLPSELDEEPEVELSQHLHQQIALLMQKPEQCQQLQPYLRQPDALIELLSSSQARLPPLDWNGAFRKAYTLLFWIRPNVANLNRRNSGGATSEAAETAVAAASGVEDTTSATLSQDPAEYTSSEATSSPPGRRIWYRFSTTADDASGAGICVLSGEWTFQKHSNTLSTTLTAFALPPRLELLQIPLTLPANEFSLVGFSHSFPYLKRPQWTVCVNGEIQGQGELQYPIVDVPLSHAVVLQNLTLGGARVVSNDDSSTARDDTHTPASQLNTSSREDSTKQTIPWTLQFLSMALHKEVLSADVQALVSTGGPALSLQQGGKVLPTLPPVDNWTKGSSLEGPNVGIPLAVHPLALQVQHLQDKVVSCFGACHAQAKVYTKATEQRIVVPQQVLPGETDSTPKVGLLQPSVPVRHGDEEETPSLQFVGQVKLVHALSDYLLHSSAANLNPLLGCSSPNLSVLLAEQGVVPAVVLPFFLAQLPAGHGLDLQQDLLTSSLEYLYNLYTNQGAWAANLITLLADLVHFGGGRSQEMVLQGGVLHVLASALRKSLIRAQQLQVHQYGTLEQFMAGYTKEEAWWRPTHDEACPKRVPLLVAKACARLVAVCCGVSVEVDYRPATKLTRSSDLALSAVFGLAWNFDLWGKQETALVALLKPVALRYGNVQGGQVLRRQIPIQSLLDAMKSRLEFTTNPEIGVLLNDVVQHMLLASLSHSKNIAIGEHDISACLAALSDCPLGSVGTHVILSSLTNILDWCNTGNDEDLVPIASRLGRNLLMGQYHDVIAPMMLSRTVFCGERSMSHTPPAASWEHHWRMALTLFTWVSSISGPEGVAAAQATGSLLLASGAAGSLRNCLIMDTLEKNSHYLANLFLPPPTMALIVGSNRRHNSDSWTYTDLLSDRLQVMMPLMPGLVMSLIHDEDDWTEPELLVLEDMLSAMRGSFHRIFGVLLAPSPQRRSSNVLTHDQTTVVKAAKDYAPCLVLIATWLEHQIRKRTQQTNSDTFVVLRALKPDERKNTEVEGSWVDVSSPAFPEDNVDEVLDPLFERYNRDSSDSDLVKRSRQCLKCVLATIADLIANAIRVGGGELSTSLWRSVVSTLRDAMAYSGGKKSRQAQSLARDILCRLAAIVLTKVQRRDYDWEMWSVPLCGGVARLCDLVEEKKLLYKNVDGYSRDQIVLASAVADVLHYGRDMTGWCQLILPTPPLPNRSRQEGEPESTVESSLAAVVEATDNLFQGVMMTPEKPEYSINTDTLDAGRHYVPPEAPGATSKLLLPVLQPCLRVTMSTLGTLDASIKVTKPKFGKSGADVPDESISFVENVIQELKSTLVAAIVGLNFPNARDTALHGMVMIRRIVQEDKCDEQEKEALLDLFVTLVEEIRARYEGERRRREKALFDAYEEEEGAREAESSQVIERLILGGDLVPTSSDDQYVEEKPSIEEITFGDDNAPSQPATPAKQISGNEDFVMFHESYGGSGDKTGLDNMLRKTGGSAQLGWDQYKGLGSALEECKVLVNHAVEQGKAQDSKSKTHMYLSLLTPYLDTWDNNTAKEAEDSEIVLIFDSLTLSEGKNGHKDEELPSDGQVPLNRSETAADAMTTYIEMASIEKSRLSDYVNTFLPSHRYSCQAYAERYCWSNYFEIIGADSECDMENLFERGIADGNRDIRSRLITMPCNPQFKRYIPKYLDHSDDGALPIANTGRESEEGEEPMEVFTSSSGSKQRSASMLNPSPSPMSREEAMRRAASSRIESSSDDAGLDIHKSLIQAVGDLAIVDITKKAIPEDEALDPDVPDILPEGSDLIDDSEDDVYGDGSLGFPSRDDDDGKKSDSETEPTFTSVDSDESQGITATKVAAKEHGAANHHIASSIYSHPPDNSSSILSLLHSSHPALIEKHFDNCLHVKAEGSRKCTMLLSTTHLILEYDAEDVGLFEGELMAVHEEAERQRLIEEAGGGSDTPDADNALKDQIEEQLERRQKEMAAMRPKSIRWNLSELSHVYLRRYRLRDSAIEMFFIPSGGSSFGGFGIYSPATSLFLDFGSGRDANKRRDDAAHAIMRRSPPQTIKQWPDKSGQFLHEQLSRLTMGWVEGRITNFDYLLHLNMLAGRSYNDLCQYPVMPWVLSNYTSPEIPDLTDLSNFRDLAKPVGALNPDRLRDFLERFETFADPTIPPFMYGSHYSTSAGVVLHFLVRMHPFAGLHRQLQGGYFDVADRLFSSVPRTWDMCTGYSAAEVKELTPEWYCNPAFLKNTNDFKLGTSQDGELLGDVVLPPWAKGSPEIFVEVMRNALESDICSDMLPDWIDLIFGRKQQGPEAIKANNVFFYLTYYGSVDVASIEDEGLRQATELQIAHFGQCPMQLFVRPHVRRVQKILHYRKLTFYQMLSAYTQGAASREASEHHIEYNLDGSQRLFGEPLFLPFFSAPVSHWIHLDAPPPGPHADLIAVRLAGVDRCLAIDANGIFHSFRWAWKPAEVDESEHQDGDDAIDIGNFVAQRELPRFRTIPRLLYVPPREEEFPAVTISKTLFASRSVLLVLSDGDGRGALAMQLVDPAKGSVKGEAVVPAVHSARITCIAMDPIGTAAGHGGVGGELAIVGSADGGASLWRFMSSHYLPLRPRIRMRGHMGAEILAVALSSAIHICATVSAERCCIFSLGNGAMIRSWAPPENTLKMMSGVKTKTVFCDTPALGISVQGFVVTVCKTTVFNDNNVPTRNIITLHLFSLEGVSLGSKALESWRGVPHRLGCTPDGTAVTVCSGRGVTIHRLSAITPLEFIDEWHVTEADELNEHVPAAWDVDFGPSLMRPVVAASACSAGVLRLHALPGITPWSERHKKTSIGFGKAFSKTGGRIKNVMGKGFGFGKAFVGAGKEVSKEVSSEVKERGVGGFLSGTLFRKNQK